MMVDDILDYWYAMEYFSPCWPVDPQKDTNLLNSELPWPNNQKDPKCRISYDVYFGKIPVSELTRWFQKALKINPEDCSTEKTRSNTCVFALKVDEDGRYVPKSFAISTLVWAICKLVSSGSLNQKLNRCDFEMLQESIDQQITIVQEGDNTFTLSKEYLSRIYQGVQISIQLPNEVAPYVAWSTKHIDYADKNGVFPKLNPSTELMQSFYLKDLKQVQGAATESVRRYTEALLNNQVEHIHIDRDILHMQEWVKAEKYPLGAWPSVYRPSLMQQLGINLAISGEQKIFSVNGPPGTGKTTLLKEIVASNVVQRAIAMMSYQSPDDAFVKRTFRNPVDRFHQTFYEMAPELAHFGMIVASNNNAAVENISIELPKLIESDRTGHFSTKHEDFSENTYFSEIASELVAEPCWGLISAKLGKKNNTKKLVERLWWAEDGKTLKHYYDALPCDSDQAAENWNHAKEAFQKALDAVECERKEISCVQHLLQTLEQEQEKYQPIKAAAVAQNAAYSQAVQSLKDSQSNLAKLDKRLNVEDENKSKLRARIPVWKWLIRGVIKNDQTISAWKESDELAKNLEIEIAKERRACEIVREHKELCESEWQATQEEAKRQACIISDIDKLLDSKREPFEANWADDHFWQNIQYNEESQTACPWTTTAYDKRREELFYRALMLHKAFILHSNAVKQNMNRLFAVWDDKITGQDRKTAYGHLFNTLQLLIPVVSTTFASVQSFLDGIGAEELGMLIIDEAGQATPQSAVGAIWRTKRVVVVGDPFQVEPIVTVPKALQLRFADEHRIPSAYRLPEISVQMLADGMNQFGGERIQCGEPVWLGCPLVVHRRCIDPMFTISNEIAYNGRMFSKTKPPSSEQKFLFDTSVWLDCKGKEVGNQNHVVLAQIELAGRLFERAIEVYGKLPDLYFITPFTSVARELSQILTKSINQHKLIMNNRAVRDWVSSHCGTIHTFQGKQAAEVLLVLGCDSQSGKGAASWVGQKPNIINVAVSRAEYRLGVIGDYELWRGIAHVQNVCDHLPVITAIDWLRDHCDGSFLLPNQ